MQNCPNCNHQMEQKELFTSMYWHCAWCDRPKNTVEASKKSGDGQISSSNGGPPKSKFKVGNKVMHVTDPHTILDITYIMFRSPPGKYMINASNHIGGIMDWESEFTLVNKAQKFKAGDSVKDNNGFGHYIVKGYTTVNGIEMVELTNVITQLPSYFPEDDLSFDITNTFPTP